jgi:ABC-type glutathione transport system ATPase component
MIGWPTFSARSSMSDQKLLLEVQGLRKEFNVRNPAGGHMKMLAVDDVSFTLAPGESFAIVGESGSGKSTLARMIVGLERPTRGEIVFDGRSRSRPPRGTRERRRRAKEAQIVFQNPYASLDPRQRVNDALGEALTVHRRLDREERRRAIDGLLEQVGLDDRHGRSYPRALSGGQRQRVAIARCLAAEPQLLVLDEAVAALDVSIQAQVLNLLADIRERSGMSFLFISHDLAVVRQLTEQIIVMRDGRVVERGRTAEVLSSPHNEYTRLLRDSVPRPGWKAQRQLTSQKRLSIATPTSQSKE